MSLMAGWLGRASGPWFRVVCLFVVRPGLPYLVGSPFSPMSPGEGPVIGPHAVVNVTHPRSSGPLLITPL